MDNADAGIWVVDSSMADIAGNHIGAMRAGPEGRLNGIGVFYYGEVMLGRGNRIEVDSDRFTITGSAADANGMRDLQIFVQHENDYRKVFFKTARKPGQMSAPGATALEFTAELPLKPGNSTVYLIAREDDDLQAQRTIVIHRKAPAVAWDGGHCTGDGGQ